MHLAALYEALFQFVRTDGTGTRPFAGGHSLHTLPLSSFGLVPLDSLLTSQEEEEEEEDTTDRDPPPAQRRDRGRILF
jgi:hypothetical protein